MGLTIGHTLPHQWAYCTTSLNCYTSAVTLPLYHNSQGAFVCNRAGILQKSMPPCMGIVLGRTQGPIAVVMLQQYLWNILCNNVEILCNIVCSTPYNSNIVSKLWQRKTRCCPAELPVSSRLYSLLLLQVFTPSAESIHDGF